MGILPGATGTKCKNSAQQILQAIGITDATVVVTPTAIAATSPQVTVDITLNLKTSHGFVFTPYILGKSLQASCSLRRERRE